MPHEPAHKIYPPILQRARELRQPQTPAEQRLWASLRNRQLSGFKFRRQHPIERFIVDFFCHECSLVVEVDGDSHASQVEYDQARTEWLTDRGYQVLRFTNQEVVRQLPAVLDAIWRACVERVASEDSPSP